MGGGRVVIDVVPVEVDVRIPSHSVCVVAMQPFIRLHTPHAEPFRWADDAVDAQMDAVRRVLDVAEHGVNDSPAVFTLFPEYTIPGVAGASVIDERIPGNAWPSNSVVIAGIDGLDKSQYQALCDILKAQVADTNQPDLVPDEQWVNCCVMWTKDRDGAVRRWIQPKIRPNWDETALPCQVMYRGSSVFVFEGQYKPSGYPCRFTTLICSDWVTKFKGSTVRHELLEKLNTLWAESKPDLDWVFVMQHNRKPNHPSFLNGTLEFLTDHSHAYVHRDNAIVFHINTAASQLPACSGKRGFTACIVSPRAPVMCTGSPPTVRTQQAASRGDLQTCKDAVFREMGECIHAFTVRVPRSLDGVADDKSYAVTEAHVHATRDTTDPRLCGGPVAASVKWANDVLDELPTLADTQLLAGRPLEHRGRRVGDMVTEGLRSSDGQRAIDCADWATCAFSEGTEWRGESRRRHADLWKEPEKAALEHTLHSLTCIGMAYSLDVADASWHGAIETDDGYVQIVAIRGDTHADCARHYRDVVATRSMIDPVIVVVHDPHGLPILEEEISAFTGADEGRGITFLDYHTLAMSCRNASSKEALRGDLGDCLPETRRIM